MEPNDILCHEAGLPDPDNGRRWEDEPEPEGSAADYVKALFEGMAVRQKELCATNDTQAIAASNATFRQGFERLDRALHSLAEAAGVKK